MRVLRVRVPRLRLTFLWRFTLVTLAVTVLSAAVLAVTMERAHRKAIEINAEVSALGRLSADLAAPLDSLTATGRLTAATRLALTRAVDNVKLFDYVSGARVYRPDGTPIFPLDAPPAAQEVRAALASDNFLRVDHGALIAAYAPLYTRNEQAYVIAVDFEQAQLGGTYARERAELFTVVGIVSGISFISLLTLALGASRELERRRREAQSTFVHTLGIMAEVIDLRDPYTAGHSKRVAVYSRQLAVAAGLTHRQIDVIESGALLHDIGKIGVPDAVLFKPAGLNTEERRIMSTHPVVGARLLSGISAMGDVVPCVLHHHERLDGKGYPDQLLGEDIPLGARVIAVADTFDAMTTDRPYRGALSSETALKELVRVAGTQLDEHLVLVFAQLVVRGEIVPPPSLAQREASAQAPVPAQAQTQAVHT